MYIIAVHNNTLQEATVFECLITNACDAIGNGYTRQVCTIKSSLANTSDAVWDYNTFNSARVESSLANTCNAIRDSAARQTIVVCERQITNGDHSIPIWRNGRNIHVNIRTRSDTAH